MTVPDSQKPHGHDHDIHTRALSVTDVEKAFVHGVYQKLSVVYDWIFGPTLHPGRVQALQRMHIRPQDHILEVGVGTGINLSMYPKDVQVTGIDLSHHMLEKARERIVKKGLAHTRVLEMDATHMSFPDDTFDIVYAPYLISVVPDPVAVAQEMNRVCKPGGCVVILNHFKSPNKVLAKVETMISPMTVHIGFKSDLDLPALLAQTGLKPLSIEKVNLPPIWSLVTCVKPGRAAGN